MITFSVSRIGALCSSAVLLSQLSASGQLYSDNFQTDSSANWSIYGISANGMTNDYTAQFAFDYSTQAYRFNGATNFVPASPNSSGTTKGLKVTVNKNGNTSPAAVSLYPNGQSFSGNYSLKFDLWMDYSGDIPFGNGGSTEFASFGLNHLGTQVNWHNSPPNGDGVWFAVTGEGGTLRDYRAYVGDSPPGPNIELTTASGGFLDRDGDGELEQNNPDGGFSPFQLMFPAPPGQTAGAIGKQWVQAEVRQRDGTITWLLNGYVIAEHSNNNGFTSGNIMLGNMDLFLELPEQPNENYAIFDNVRVIDLTATTPLPTVDISATDSDASEPGSNRGTFTVTRTGDTTAPLTVNLRVGGSASNGVDYVMLVTSVMFASGASETNITVTPNNDSIGEPGETVMLALVGSPNTYDIRTNFAVVNITDDGDIPIATITAKTFLYENLRARGFSVNLSNPNSTDTTLAYTISGTATNGVHYTMITSSVLIPAGETNAVVTITPINDSVINSNRTVTLTLSSGSGFTVGSPASATMTIRNDDLTTGPLLFADNFDADTLANWMINRSESDGTAIFAYDYSVDGIPSAPNSTNGVTRALKLQANDTNGVTSGISVSPIGQSFTGDYRLRFDAWINYNGPPLFDGGSQSTEFLSAGVGTKGVTAQWSGGGAVVDGIWISTDGDGGNGRDYRIWKENVEVQAGSNPGVYPAGSQAVGNSYYAEFGDDPAPAAQQAAYPSVQTGTTGTGNQGFAWHDMVINKQGTNVTWFIDGLLIATLNIGTTTLSTNIFVGFYDPTLGVSPIPDLAFGLVDNLRVYSLAPPQIASIQIVGSNVQIDFTGGPYDVLQSASVVSGPYADVSATITQLNPSTFRAVRALSGSMQFYRIRR